VLGAGLEAWLLCFCHLNGNNGEEKNSKGENSKKYSTDIQHIWEV